MVPNPAPPVNCQYGAPMGRMDNGNDFDALKPLSLQRLRLDTGGYDQGGAYWGHGLPIYCIQDDDGFYLTLRAHSRNGAKAAFRCQHEDAWFHGEPDPNGKGPWEVITALPGEYGQGAPYYSRLTHRDRMTWTKRTATRHAREFKAAHLRDAWAQPAA